MPPTTHSKRDPKKAHEDMVRFTPHDPRHFLITNLILAGLMIVAWPDLVKGYG